MAHWRQSSTSGHALHRYDHAVSPPPLCRTLRHLRRRPSADGGAAAVLAPTAYVHVGVAVEAPRAHVVAAARGDDTAAVGAGGEVQAVAGEVPDRVRSAAEAGVVEEEGRALGGGAAVGHLAELDAAMAEPAHRPLGRALLAPEAVVGVSRVGVAASHG
uniref:Uncharacterized protein n=1 Tax=Oryza nivara TaxID=4536 RepID=A0A0E0IF45_ORYNI